MSGQADRWSERARIALGAIRLVNGVLGLVAPAILIRRLGSNPATSPAALYAFRLFGVRTVLLAVELLAAEGPVREHARRTAIVVHASDTTAAALGAWRRELPPQAAMATVAISAVNTMLALLTWPRGDASRGAAPTATLAR